MSEHRWGEQDKDGVRACMRGGCTVVRTSHAWQEKPGYTWFHFRKFAMPDCTGADAQEATPSPLEVVRKALNSMGACTCMGCDSHPEWFVGGTCGSCSVNGAIAALATLEESIMEEEREKVMREGGGRGDSSRGSSRAHPRQGEEMSVRFEVPILVKSANNLREHPMARHERVKKQRRATGYRWPGWKAGPLLVVRLTRLAPRSLDGDNLQGALKGVRDEVAAKLLLDDASPLVRWDYRQEKAPTGKESVRVEVLSPAEAADEASAVTVESFNALLEAHGRTKR